MLYKARLRAKARGLPCTITRSDIPIPNFCPVLGIPIAKTYGRVSPGTPSIDRFDSSKGYVPGNVRVISYRANTLKNNGTIDELRAVLAYLEQSPTYLPVQHD